MVAMPHNSPEPAAVAQGSTRSVGSRSHAWMYSRLLAGDPTWNGRFFTGVRTTGIYCLPSCKARKPKSENVTFFPTCEAARASGLRPCKKCHPDDYARGADPVRETIETVVTELRETPARYRDARAVVTRTGFGSTRAFELFRLHYHATPAELLTRARVDFAASQLLATRAALLDVAADAGFESVSAFHVSSDVSPDSLGATIADCQRPKTSPSSCPSTPPSPTCAAP